MAAGVVPVTSYYWGLIDTLKDAGIMLPMPQGRDSVYTPEYQSAWVNETVKLLTNRDYFSLVQAKGFERVERFTWSAVASQWDKYFKTRVWTEI